MAHIGNVTLHEQQLWQMYLTHFRKMQNHNTHHRYYLQVETEERKSKLRANKTSKTSKQLNENVEKARKTYDDITKWNSLIENNRSEAWKKNRREPNRK